MKIKSIEEYTIAELERRLDTYLEGKKCNLAGLCTWLGCTLTELEYRINGEDLVALLLRQAVSSIVDKLIKDDRKGTAVHLVNSLRSDYYGRLYPKH